MVSFLEKAHRRGSRVGLHAPEKIRVLNILYLPGIEENICSCPAHSLFAILTMLSLLLSNPKVRKYLSFIKFIAHYSCVKDHGFKSKDVFVT